MSSCTPSDNELWSCSRRWSSRSGYVRAYPERLHPHSWQIMFYGYPVERLCTFQYSLVSLLPGLLQNLDDCGSPPLATRAPTLSKATSLKTSDHKSMLAFLGLPLDVFGKDAFFQPYLPLQQLDMIHNTPSWLCGCTNSIITQQKEIDLLVNVSSSSGVAGL